MFEQFECIDKIAVGALRRNPLERLHDQVLAGAAANAFAVSAQTAGKRGAEQRGNKSAGKKCRAGETDSLGIHLSWSSSYSWLSGSTTPHSGQYKPADAACGQLLRAGRCQIEVDHFSGADGRYHGVVVHTGFDHGNDLVIGESFGLSHRLRFRSRLGLHRRQNARADSVTGERCSPVGRQIEGDRLG